MKKFYCHQNNESSSKDPNTTQDISDRGQVESQDLTNRNYSQNKSNFASTKSNTCLSFFEAIACIFIVLIHCKFPGYFGEIIAAIGDFGVPFFFIVSGFYLFKPEMSVSELRHKLLIRIKKMALLLLFSLFIYLSSSIIEIVLINKSSILEWVQVHFFQGKLWLKLILFNFPLSTSSDWYMLASIYCYAFIYIFASLFLNKKWPTLFFSATLPLWIVYGLCINKFDPVLFGHSLGSLEAIPRTWFAVGMPFICLGAVIKRKKAIIEQKTSPFYITLLSLSLILKIVEHFLFINFFGGDVRYTLGNILTAVALISISIIKPNLMSRSKLINQKGNWTMFVYVLQTLFIGALNFLYSKTGFNNVLIALWFKPLICVLLTVCASLVLNKICVLFFSGPRKKQS